MDEIKTLKDKIIRLERELQETRQKLEEQPAIEDDHENYLAFSGNWESIVQNSPDVIIRLDLSFNYLYVNNTIEKITGYPPSSCIGHSIFDKSFPLDNVSPFIEKSKEVIRTGKQSEHLAEFLTQGRSCFLHLIIKPEFNPGGNVDSLLIITREIPDVFKELELKIQDRTSELKDVNMALDKALENTSLAYEEAEKERQRLFKVFMNAPGLIAALEGTSLVYEFMNPAYQNAFVGKKLVNKNFFESMPELENQEIGHVLKEVQSSGKPYYGVEYPVVVANPKGEMEQRYFNFIFQPETNKDRVGRIFIYAYEITDQVKARRLVEEDVRKLQLIVEALPQMAFILETDGNMVYFNQRWHEYTGKDEHGEGYHWTSIIHPDQYHEYKKTWDLALYYKSPYYQNIYLKNRYGKYKWFMVYINPVKDKEDNVINWIGTCTDIHEQINQTQALNKKNKELQNINRYLDNFVHAVAHDLRTPVANLQLISRIINKAPVEKKEELIDNIIANVNRLDLTLKGLVQIIDTQGKKEIYEPEIQVKKVIDNVIMTEKNRIAQSNAEITVKCRKNLRINYVRSYLNSIFSNMISNSLKYRSEVRPLEIKITCEKEKDKLKIIYEDNGIGIDLKKYGDNLFQPFKRFTAQGKGLGIGLYIINTMVTKNGGHIQIESEPGKGARFVFFLNEY
ncbi:MAG: PAS domain-containing sensor histidine kinase [bacterium]